MKQIVFQCTLVCMFGFAAFADSPKTIDFGGPRKVVATVAETGARYEINVSLIAVRCFDAAMNKRLSHDKARSYAIEALLRYLGNVKQQLKTASQLEIIESNIAEGRFVLVMHVPKKGLIETKAIGQEVKTKSLEHDDLRSAFNAKDDYQETLLFVKKMLAEDLPTFSGNLLGFYEAVSNAEEVGIARLTSLDNEIRVDRWLLYTEREELLQSVAMAEADFLSDLRKHVKQIETCTEGDE